MGSRTRYDARTRRMEGGVVQAHLNRWAERLAVYVLGIGP
jgi:hypothetical protein